MCPHHINPPRPRTVVVPTVQSARYTEWADTGICVIAVYLQNKYSGSKLCTECYNYEASDDQTRDRVTDYEVISRHCLKFGFEPYYEECGHCSVLLGNEQALHDCETCTEIYFNFLDHILDTGDTPYLAAAPTIIAISQIRRPVPDPQSG